MKLLFELDKKDYQGLTEITPRTAVRAIILQNDTLAMVKSKIIGCYKFPGGGIDNGETHIQALIRETKEETGLSLIPESIKEFGKVHELRKCYKTGNKIFNHTSYYYFTEASDILSSQSLDDYELELGYCLEYVTIEKAYQTNIILSKDTKHSFIIREAKVLELLLKEHS